MSQDMMMFQAADASAATALVSDGSDGSLWGVSLPVGTVMAAEDDRVLILTDTAVAGELEIVVPEEVVLLRAGGFRGVDNLSDQCLCYYLIGKASA